MPQRDLVREVFALRTQDNKTLDGLAVWDPKGTPRGGIVSIHPDSSRIQHFELDPLARSGFLALRMKSRFAGDNVNMIMEEIMIDIAAGVEFLRNRGCQKVALFGHSGGGSLMSFYQSQAENPTVTATPAGDPPDLTKAKLPAADALVFTNAHLGRHIEFTSRIDPSVTDESDPLSLDPSLDMYDSANFEIKGGGIVYAPEFLDKYCQAQKARCDRITDWVKSKLEEINKRNHPGIHDLPFIIYRTMANPRFLDRVNFKSGMPTGTLWGNPYVLNYTASSGREGPFITVKSWLSALYYGTANADTRRQIARATVPFLYVGGTADYGGDVAEAIYQSALMTDKKLAYVEGATHWFENDPGHPSQAAAIISTWLKERGF